MRRLALAVAATVLLVLVVAQLVLPGVAEQRVRDDLEASGATVRSVSVSAFPAVKLLWGRADAVRLRVSGARLAASGDLADELERTRATDELDATVDELELGPLVLRDLRLRKRGPRLRGEASVTRADLAAASPLAVELEPVESRDGVLVLRARAGPLTVRARLSASDGKLRVAPDGLLGGFASVTVFEDPRVLVEGVGARPRAGGFTFTADGRLAS